MRSPNLIARKERWPLRQHRQHRLQPPLGPCGRGREPGRQLSSQPGYAGTSGLLFCVGSRSTIADAADGADGVFGK